MPVELETRTIEQLKRVVTVAVTDLLTIQAEGGDMGSASVQQVVDALNAYVFAENTAKLDGLSAAVGSYAAGAIIDVKKATKAALDADLAWVADKIGWVHSDPDVSKNDLYVKSGGSGAGAWAATGVFKAAAEALVQAYATAAEDAKDDAEAAAAVATSAAIVQRDKALELADKLERIKPTNAAPVRIFVIDPDAKRCRIRTKSVLNGDPDDFDEWDIIEIGDYLRSIDPTIGANPCWVLHSNRASVGGKFRRWCEQPLNVGHVSAWEHATMVGKMADAPHYTGGENAYFRRYGGVHGHIKLLGGHVFGDGINISSGWEFGDDFAAAELLFYFTYQAMTPDGTPIPGAHTISHIFDANGVTDDHQISSTAESPPGTATYGHQDAYVMYPATEIDRAKLEGQAAIPLGGLTLAGGSQSIQKPTDGPTINAWNGSSTKRISYYRNAEPSIIFEHNMPLVDRMQPYPGKSQCLSSAAFAIDNLDPATRIMNQKGYLNLMSSDFVPGLRAPLPMLGSYRFVSNRRTTIRPGGAL